jgi:hypothetical protein
VERSGARQLQTIYSKLSNKLGTGASFKGEVALYVKGAVLALVALLASSQAEAEIVTVNFGYDDRPVGYLQYDDAALPTIQESYLEGTEQLEYNSGQVKSFNLFRWDGSLKSFDLSDYVRLKLYHVIDYDFLLFSFVAANASEYVELTLQMQNNTLTGPYLPKSFDDRELYGDLYYDGQDGVSGSSINQFRVPSVSTVPELSTWAGLIAGFAFMGGAARYRRRRAKLQFA